VSLEIRPVRPEEYEEAGAVTALAYREFAPRRSDDWEDYLRRIADVGDRAERTTVLVAVEGGSILGTLTLELTDRTEAGHEREDDPLPPEEAHIRMLGVHPDARGRGIGRALMDASLRHARDAGKTLLTLNTTERMRAAQAMYESMGFTREPDRVFDDGFVLLSYSLALAE
jgi:ribosomal protein S18 acetylase RimI-like enzyme